MLVTLCLRAFSGQGRCSGCTLGSLEVFARRCFLKYLVDEFADLKVMRYYIPEWENLTLQQKEYIYYLGEAAKCGRDILADQNFKYNLTVRKTLEAILNSYKGDKKCADYQNFVVYAKRVFFSNGIHHHYAEDKMFPEISFQMVNQMIV